MILRQTQEALDNSRAVIDRHRLLSNATDDCLRRSREALIRTEIALRDIRSHDAERHPTNFHTSTFSEGWPIPEGYAVRGLRGPGRTT